MSAVEVGQVEDADPAVVSPLEERFELLLPHPRMIGLAVIATHSGPEAETADLEFGLAEPDSLVRVEKGGLGFRGVCQRHTRQYSAEADGGPFHKLTALDLHGRNGGSAGGGHSAFILCRNVSTPWVRAQPLLGVVHEGEPPGEAGLRPKGAPLQSPLSPVMVPVNDS